ncbi:GNAT family N-acetyltransferase [Scytonema sp. NUACC26]|uniref:GNAT family N-acetyltransferase n=1 Tax=Scytonema sp. NUACC26 TaxID=3140176 RepID=UPI0034DC59E7
MKYVQTEVLETVVTFATEKTLPSLKALADAHRREIGFVNRATLAKAIAHQEILCTSFGFLHFHHRRDRISTLYHLCVCPSQRGKGVGKQLVNEWEKYSRKCGMTTLRLKCPLDLNANGFYYKMGFTRIDIEPGAKRSLVIWEKKLLYRKSLPPQFVAAITASGSELKRLFELWKSGGDLDRNPFRHIISSPIACRPSTIKFLKQEKNQGNIKTVWLDCGAYQVQQGKRTYDELLTFLDKFYREHLWADGYVLPDIVPLTTDSDKIVESKVCDTLFYCERFFKQMPSYVQERAIAPVHGRNVNQINRCVETYAKLGIQRIGFGSWGTSGPNGSVNMLSRDSLALFQDVYNIAKENKMDVHCFGIGGPNSFNRLHRNNLVPDSLDSTTWWKAGGFGSIFFPNTSQIQITQRRGIETTKEGLEKLKRDTQHSCYFCESIEQLRTSRNHRIMHNLAAWLDTLERAQ